jgi:carbon monoxide dehydrogenase subunit G
MGLRFEHAFMVKAAPEKVWAYLIDPYRVAPALPGATITEKVDEQTYGGQITVKVGPVSARYKGTLKFENVDASARSADMVAKGQDVSGRGGADMRMQSRLTEKAPGETEVTVVSDVNVTGILAQMGRGLIQDVSNQMFQKFTQAVRAELEKPDEPAASSSGSSPPAPAAPPTPAPPIEVVSFGTKILARAVGRIMRKPIFWVVVAGVVGILYWWFAKR